MRRIVSMFLGLVAGGGLMWGAMQYHVLRTKDGIKLVPKRSTTLADTYLDVRTWGLADWSQHPDVVWTLTQNGQTDVIGNAGTLETTFKDVLNFKK